MSQLDEIDVGLAAKQLLEVERILTEAACTSATPKLIAQVKEKLELVHGEVEAALNEIDEL